MRKSRSAVKDQENVLDTISPKGSRGRHRKVSPAVARGRADNYRGFLDNAWDRLSPALLEAQNVDDVINVLQSDAMTREGDLNSQSSLILKVLQHPTFSKRRHA